MHPLHLSTARPRAVPRACGTRSTAPVHAAVQRVAEPRRITVNPKVSLGKQSAAFRTDTTALPGRCGASASARSAERGGPTAWRHPICQRCSADVPTAGLCGRLPRRPVRRWAGRCARMRSTLSRRAAACARACVHLCVCLRLGRPLRTVRRTLRRWLLPVTRAVQLSNYAVLPTRACVPSLCSCACVRTRCVCGACMRAVREGVREYVRVRSMCSCAVCLPPHRTSLSHTETLPDCTPRTAALRSPPPHSAPAPTMPPPAPSASPP